MRNLLESSAKLSEYDNVMENLNAMDTLEEVWNSHMGQLEDVRDVVSKMHVETLTEECEEVCEDSQEGCEESPACGSTQLIEDSQLSEDAQAQSQEF